MKKYYLLYTREGFLMVHSSSENVLPHAVLWTLAVDHSTEPPTFPDRDGKYGINDTMAAEMATVLGFREIIYRGVPYTVSGRNLQPVFS